MSKNLLPPEVEFLTPSAHPKLKSSLFWGFPLELSGMLDSYVEWLAELGLNPTLESFVVWIRNYDIKPSFERNIGLSLETKRENIFNSLAEWLAEGGANYDVYAYLASELSLNMGIGCQDVLASAIDLALETRRNNVLNRSIDLSLETRRNNILTRNISLSLETKRENVFESLAECGWPLELNNVLSRSLSASILKIETRYMNNLEYLTTEQTTPYDEITLQLNDELNTWYFGIKVYIVHVVGNPTLISGTNAVSIASGSTTGLKTGANWACPQTTMVATDKVRVEVYCDLNNPPTTLRQAFETVMLGSSSLETATWVAYYYLFRSGTIHNYNYSFRYGSSLQNTKIANFKWLQVIA